MQLGQPRKAGRHAGAQAGLPPSPSGLRPLEWKSGGIWWKVRQPSLPVVLHFICISDCRSLWALLSVSLSPSPSQGLQTWCKWRLRVQGVREKWGFRAVLVAVVTRSHICQRVQSYTSARLIPNPLPVSPPPLHRNHSHSLFPALCPPAPASSSC